MIRPCPHQAVEAAAVSRKGAHVAGVGTNLGPVLLLANESSCRTILIVEDDADLRSLLTGLLEADGYRVWAAEDVRAAKDALERGRPDLILLDLTLPDGDGLLFCSELREGGNIPIIACSGAMRRSDGVVGLWLGADDFIAKPFNIDNLEARIAAVLRHASEYRSRTAAGPYIALGS
jgi:DNA-binding response OmpR family regulator